MHYKPLDIVTEEMKNFLNEFSKLIEKYGVDFEIQLDGWGGVIGIDVGMAGKWDEDGETIKEYSCVNLPNMFDHTDIKSLLVKYYEENNK